MPMNPVSITVPMSESMKTWIAEQAAAERRTMAEIVRFIIQKEMTWQKLWQEKEKRGATYGDATIHDHEVLKEELAKEILSVRKEKETMLALTEAKEILENELEKSKCATELNIPSNR